MQEAWEQDESVLPIHTAIRTKKDIEDLRNMQGTNVVVIYGDTVQMSPAACATVIKMTVKNPPPLIYFSRNQLLGHAERAAFYDAGGDSVFDIEDIGPEEQGEDMPRLLVKKITALARRQRHIEMPTPRTLAFPEIMIDPIAKNVLIEGTRRDLPLKKFMIFSILARYAPEMVWYETFEKEIFKGKMTPNTLETHISQINKLIKPFKIVSVIRMGYKLTRITEQSSDF